MTGPDSGSHNDPRFVAALLSRVARAHATGGVVWRKEGPRHVGTIPITVAALDIETARIEITANEFRPGEPTMAYIADGGWIRRLCINRPHRPIDGTHKHRLERAGEEPYAPTDIPPLPLSPDVDPESYREVVAVFAAECFHRAGHRVHLDTAVARRRATMTTRLAASILHAVNDLTAVRAYGDGWLVDTPFTYSDGDAITVLVDPIGTGFRITDRAEALDRLSSWGVAPDSARAAAGIQAARDAGQLSPVASHTSETATIAEEADLGAAILAVGQAALRVEQLRWLAQDRPAINFDDRLATRVEMLSESHKWTMTRRAQIRMRTGRVRRVTASVQGPAGTAYIQAVSDSDQERSVANCYYLFDRSIERRDRRVSALAGDPGSWPSGLREDLEAVSLVTFFAEPTDLEATLERITGTALTI